VFGGIYHFDLLYHPAHKRGSLRCTEGRDAKAQALKLNVERYAFRLFCGWQHLYKCNKTFDNNYTRDRGLNYSYNIHQTLIPSRKFLYNSSRNAIDAIPSSTRAEFRRTEGLTVLPMKIWSFPMFFTMLGIDLRWSFCPPKYSWDTPCRL
jgi:hypothetical protein